MLLVPLCKKCKANNPETLGRLFPVSFLIVFSLLQASSTANSGPLQNKLYFFMNLCEPATVSRSLIGNKLMLTENFENVSIDSDAVDATVLRKSAGVHLSIALDKGKAIDAIIVSANRCGDGTAGIGSRQFAGNVSGHCRYEQREYWRCAYILQEEDSTQDVFLPINGQNLNIATGGGANEDSVKMKKLLFNPSKNIRRGHTS